MLPMIKKVMPILCIFLIVMVFTGCSKVNKENFDRIKIGISYEEVIGILGNPDNSEESILKTKNCLWGDEEKHIAIKFVGDIVVLKSSKGIQ